MKAAELEDKDQEGKLCRSYFKMLSIFISIYKSLSLDGDITLIYSYCSVDSLLWALAHHLVNIRSPHSNLESLLQHIYTYHHLNLVVAALKEEMREEIVITKITFLFRVVKR